MEFKHYGADIQAVHDDAYGYDWTASLNGVLFAKGWIRGDEFEIHDAIISLVENLDYQNHVYYGRKEKNHGR